MNSYYPWSKLKQLEEWRGDWNMITIERIKEIFKEEFRCNLYKTRTGSYMSKSSVVRVSLCQSGFYVSLRSVKKSANLEMHKWRITTEKDLLRLIRKFKKVRKMI